MDVFMPIALCVIFIILFTICGWCCKKKREGTVYGYGPSVTVTTTTQHVPSPQVVPPYPIDARHPLPGNNAPGFAARQQPPYPTQVPNMPFPQTAPHMYGLPPPNMGIAGAPPFQYGTYQPDSNYGQSAIWNVGFRPMTMFNPMFTCRTSQVSFPIGISNPPMTPYPPTLYQDYNSNPPPYEVAISQAPAPAPIVNEGYGKQAPYNPGYN